MNKKTVALLLALVLVFGAAVGGTLAWLTDKTDAVTNTFTVGNIDIDLKETTGTEYKMVPGSTITKDPTVTVVKNSEKCYLFINVKESENFNSFMSYAMADGWTALTGKTGIYYRVVDASTSDQAFAVINDNKITVSSDVTKTQMDALTNATLPTLTVKAAAVQFDNIVAAEGKTVEQVAFEQIETEIAIP